MPRKRLAGEGTIRQRKDGRWHAKISLGFDSTGKRIRKSVYGKTAEECQQKLNALKNQYATGLEPGVETTFGEYARAWLVTKELEVTGRTIDNYRDDLERYLMPRLQRAILHKLSARQVKQLQAEVARAHGVYTANRAQSLLGNILGDAVMEGYLPMNPVRLVKKLKHQVKRIEIWTASEIERALAAAAEVTRLYALLFVALSTGLRHGELLGLQWSRLNLWGDPGIPDADWGELRVDQAASVIDGRMTLSTPKSPAAFRTLGLDEHTHQVLEQWRERLELEASVVKGYQENDLVFPSTRGTILDQNNALRALETVVEHANPDAKAWIDARVKTLKAEGLKHRRAATQARQELSRNKGLRARLMNQVKPITVHDMRHTHASMLISAGMDPVAVARRLGHESASFTLQKYAHFFERQQRPAAPSLAKLTGLSSLPGVGGVTRGVTKQKENPLEVEEDRV